MKKLLGIVFAVVLCVATLVTYQADGFDFLAEDTSQYTGGGHGYVIGEELES